jgi:exportin-T
MAMLLRNTLQARGLEMVEFLRTDLLPKMNCPQNYADELIKQMRTQQARDFKKTYADFLKAVKGGK